MQYFGESAGPCGNCDNCLNTAPLSDGTAQAQLVLAAVLQSGERFGAAHVIDILRGANTQKIKEREHDTLSCFGSGGAHKKEEWQSLIRQMVAAEDPKKPLSDSTLSEMLEEQGIQVARRTVAKYREALKIAPANLRKAI